MVTLPYCTAALTLDPATPATANATTTTIEFRLRIIRLLLV